MVIIAVIVLAVMGMFTFSLARAASWADPDKHDLPQPSDRSKQ